MPSARVEKDDKAFLLPLVEPLRDVVELSGSSLLIWDEICASSHGISTGELIRMIADFYSTDVSEIAGSVEGFVRTLHDRGLVALRDDDE